jgi:septal ring factor EnvC (AmiA/AmiB activator)
VRQELTEVAGTLPINSEGVTLRGFMERMAAIHESIPADALANARVYVEEEEQSFSLQVSFRRERTLQDEVKRLQLYIDVASTDIDRLAHALEIREEDLSKFSEELRELTERIEALKNEEV